MAWDVSYANENVWLIYPKNILWQNYYFMLVHSVSIVKTVYSKEQGAQSHFFLF